MPCNVTYLEVDENMLMSSYAEHKVSLELGSRFGRMREETYPKSFQIQTPVVAVGFFISNVCFCSRFEW